MNICNCFLDIDAILCDIPNEWRDDIVKAICLIFPEKAYDCENIRKCETLTSLSPFNLVGNILSITFKDEKGKSTTRSTDITSAVQYAFDHSLDGVDPECLMSQEEWDELSVIDKINAVISANCECCVPGTTTTTTTTTESPCICRTYNIENVSGATVQIFITSCDSPYSQVPISIPDGVITQVCSCSGFIVPDIVGFTVTDLGDGCFATTTTSTTTTTTSTTTTSTSTSTTTTTTLPPTTTTTTTSTTTTTTIPKYQFCMGFHVNDCTEACDDYSECIP